MGTSTDAILVYGIPLTEEMEYPDYSSDEDEELPDDHPKKLAFNGKNVDGISVVLHCSSDAPMAIVAIAETENTAYRGYPKQMKPLNTYYMTSNHNKKLRKYCEKYNLETDGEPGWWLASWWG